MKRLPKERCYFCCAGEDCDKPAMFTPDEKYGQDGHHWSGHASCGKPTHKAQVQADFDACQEPES